MAGALLAFGKASLPLESATTLPNGIHFISMRHSTDCGSFQRCGTETPPLLAKCLPDRSDAGRLEGARVMKLRRNFTLSAPRSSSLIFHPIFDHAEDCELTGCWLAHHAW